MLRKRIDISLYRPLRWFFSQGMFFFVSQADFYCLMRRIYSSQEMKINAYICTSTQLYLYQLTHIFAWVYTDITVTPTVYNKRGCVKMLAQPFFMRKAQTFPSPGFVITQSLCNFRHQFFRYGKVTFLFLHSQPNRSFSTKNWWKHSCGRSGPHSQCSCW